MLIYIVLIGDECNCHKVARIDASLRDHVLDFSMYGTCDVSFCPSLRDKAVGNKRLH